MKTRSYDAARTERKLNDGMQSVWTENRIAKEEDENDDDDDDDD